MKIQDAYNIVCPYILEKFGKYFETKNDSNLFGKVATVTVVPDYFNDQIVLRVDAPLKVTLCPACRKELEKMNSGTFELRIGENGLSMQSHLSSELFLDGGWITIDSVVKNMIREMDEFNIEVKTGENCDRCSFLLDKLKE